MNKIFISIVALTFICFQIYAQTLHLEEVPDPETMTSFSINGCEYDLNVSDVVCSGDSYTFPDQSIVDNITAQVVQISTLQTVVTACDSVITTTVDPLPSYHLFVTNFDVCPGDIYTFPDGTVDTIMSHTEYTSSLQTVTYGCDSVIESILNTTDMDLSVSVSGNVLTSNQGNAGHQWVDCDNGFSHIIGQGNQTFIAPEGNFAVIIYKGGCTDTSACQQVTTVGMDDFDERAVYIYPNPTTGTFKVDLGTTFNEVTVTVRNVVGQELRKRILTDVHVFSAEINEVQGIYFLELHNSDGLNAIYRIVKE